MVKLSDILKVWNGTAIIQPRSVMYLWAKELLGFECVHHH